jgi:hypothetical protein
MILAYVINDNLDDFSIWIDSIETGGQGIFLAAKLKWGDDWNKYLVWYDGKIIQRVIHPDTLFGDKDD